MGTPDVKVSRFVAGKKKVEVGGIFVRI